MLTDRSTHSYSDSDISSLDEKLKFYFCETISGVISENIHVGVSESKIGKELITDSIKPCQGVIVKLKNGEYALYHAYNTLRSPSFIKFVSTIKEIGVEFAIVFQKDDPPTNKEKAPILAIHLANELFDLGAKVKRVHINEHTGIYVNADTKQIVLFKLPDYITGEKTNIQFGDLKEIPIEQISIKESVNTILNEKEGGIILIDGTIRYPDNTILSNRFLSKSQQLPIVKRERKISGSEQISNTDNDEKISKSSSISIDETSLISVSEKEKNHKTKSFFRSRASSQNNIFSPHKSEHDVLVKSEKSEKKSNKTNKFKVFFTRDKTKKKQQGEPKEESKEKRHIDIIRF